MGSYQRFPKASPAADAARRRDQEWRENEFRCAMRLPQEKIELRIDTSKDIRLGIDRLDIAELLSGARHSTRH